MTGADLLILISLIITYETNLSLHKTERVLQKCLISAYIVPENAVGSHQVQGAGRSIIFNLMFIGPCIILIVE